MSTLSYVKATAVAAADDDEAAVAAATMLLLLLTTPSHRSSVVFSIPFMIRSTICSTHGFSQPVGSSQTCRKRECSVIT